MEMGTMEYALLQNHNTWLEGVERTIEIPRRIIAGSTVAAAPFFTWRSGEEIADGGHRTVPSIGQPIGSSKTTMCSLARATEGTAHMRPTT